MADSGNPLIKPGTPSPLQTPEKLKPFESAFGHAPIGMALIATDGRVLQVNDALCRITGYLREKLQTTTLRSITHSEDLELDVEYQQQLLQGQIATYQVEQRYRHAWGHYVWVLVTVSLVRDEGSLPYFIEQVQDISERKELERRLEDLVDHDFLTGLFNRRRFEQELTHEVRVAARYGTPGALLLIDLDNFKDVNDEFGHKAGDDLLKTVAQALRHRVRETDVLARVGGDEFAAILPRSDAEHARVVADGIVKTLRRQTAMLGQQLIHTTASVGISMFEGLTDTEVLATADLAMYDSKEAGRNRFSMYVPGGSAKKNSSRRFDEAEQIRHAIEDDGLILYCQPIVDLDQNRVTQYELLLRLRGSKNDQPLPPSAFLYTAERFGLIQVIDAWVVRQAIELIGMQARSNRPVILNINLSGKSICDPKFAATTEGALEDAGIDPASLVFELTETAAIANLREATTFAHRLRQLGCQFALDDFGAGFGSFYYLKHLPFDFLKIDGDFVRDFVASPVDRLVVRAIVEIAEGMGKKTIAECVENVKVASLLRETGVNYAQGYHLGPPLPVREALPAS